MSLAALIAAQRAEHGVPVAVSCRALGVSQAWFFQVAQGRSVTTPDTAGGVGGHDRYLFAKHKGTYGSPRITADLRVLGWRVSGNTIATLMTEQGLVARRKRRRGTTRPDKSARKAPDGLCRDFTPPPQADVAWCGDLTEIPTDEGKLQLAAVLDLQFTPLRRVRDGHPPRRRAGPGGAVRGHRGPRRCRDRGANPHRPGQ